MPSTVDERGFSKKWIKIVFLGALSVSLSAVEDLFLPAVPLPGVSLGLNNAVFLIFLEWLKPLELLIAQLLKVFLSAILYKGLNPVQLTLALSGAFAASAVLLLYKRLIYGTSFTPISISALMATAHLTAQIAASSLVLGSDVPFAYLPFSGMASVVLGSFVGLVAIKAKLFLMRQQSLD
jgi:heptaprenyl diphosphate synthase